MGTVSFVAVFCFCLYSVTGQAIVNPVVLTTLDTLRQSNPDLLDSAVRAGESVILEYRGPMMTLIVQEDVNVYFDCAPWASNFPGGSIQWYIQLVEEDLTPRTPNYQVAVPTSGLDIGGFPPRNRWLNITGTSGTAGAADPDFGRYRCEVCVARGTPEEVCHNSTTLLYIAGAPPEILRGGDMPTNVVSRARGDGSQIFVYNIGSDFCVDPQAGNRYDIFCQNVPSPEPIPSDVTYRFSKNGIQFAEFSNGLRTINESFFDLPGNDILRPGLLVDSQMVMFDPFRIAQGAVIGLEFDTAVFNMTIGSTFTDPVLETQFLRQRIANAMVGTWTCEVSNVIGSDSASSMVRLCEGRPTFSGCEGGARAIFPMTNEVVPIGCTICIPEGSSVTIDCNAMTPSNLLFYEWRVNNVTIPTTSRTLTVTDQATYTCFARNLDFPNEMQTSVLTYSDQVSFQSRIINSAGMDVAGNGCNRLLGTPGMITDLCLLIGDAVQMSCTNAQTSAALDIMQPDGTTLAPGVVVVDSTFQRGTYTCSLNAPGDCGTVTTNMTVEVYDPARIDRVSAPVPMGSLGVGQATSVQRITRGGQVILSCGTNGIGTPNTTWTRVVETPDGCSIEEPVTVGVSEDMGDSTLTITNFGGSVTEDVTETYVCYTENIAGRDADSIVLTTIQESVAYAPDTGFGECSMMCNEGVRTRSVSCRDQDGRIVPNSRCAALDPPLTELPDVPSVMSCADLFPNECLNTPIFGVTSFPPCPVGCQGGVRERKVFCFIPMTRTIVSDNECFLNQQRKPSSIDICENKCCIQDALPNTCGPLAQQPALRHMYCSLPSIANLCCWTCANYEGSNAP